MNAGKGIGTVKYPANDAITARERLSVNPANPDGLASPFPGGVA